MRRAGWLVLVLLSLASGCLSRAAQPRYFRPASAAIDGSQVEPAALDTGAPIRLRPVRGAPLLRERIVWRASPVEYGFYEQRRWSELPASYLQRALLTNLRQTPGLRLTDEIDAPALRVTLVAFDEVLAPERVARVTLIASLEDAGRRRLLDRSFSAEAAIASEQPAATAEAMGRALDSVVADVCRAVAAAASAGGAAAPDTPDDRP